MTFGALIIAHNVIELDYCIRECIESVLPICERVLVVECESTDGTLAMLNEMAANDQRIAIINRPWKPSRNLKWLEDLTHDCKSQIGTDWYIAMDADEVIDPRGYYAIQEHVAKHVGSSTCATMLRHTFWKDPWHTIPNGIICNHLCSKVGPTTESLYGDQIDPVNKEMITSLIYHYGHLRKRPAWAKKSVEMHEAAFGEVPNHWKKAEAGDWSEIETCVPDSTLVKFDGSHPIVMHRWLKERGWET